VRSDEEEVKAGEESGERAGGGLAGVVLRVEEEEGEDGEDGEDEEVEEEGEEEEEVTEVVTPSLPSLMLFSISALLYVLLFVSLLCKKVGVDGLSMDSAEVVVVVVVVVLEDEKGGEGEIEGEVWVVVVREWLLLSTSLSLLSFLCTKMSSSKPSYGTSPEGEGMSKGVEELEEIKEGDSGEGGARSEVVDDASACACESVPRRRRVLAFSPPLSPSPFPSFSLSLSFFSNVAIANRGKKFVLASPSLP
jgi:hypothetical protein